MEKKDINEFLKKTTIKCAKMTQDYFNSQKVKDLIESRRNWSKFGLAKNEDNSSITLRSYEDIYIVYNKEEKEDINNEVETIQEKKEVYKFSNSNYNSHSNSNYTNNKKGSIKIENLPTDITEDELYDLLYDFGDIKSVVIPKSIKYRDDLIKHAYITFYDYHIAEQVVDELDNTKFDNLIINVDIV